MTIKDIKDEIIENKIIYYDNENNKLIELSVSTALDIVGISSMGISTVSKIKLLILKLKENNKKIDIDNIIKYNKKYNYVKLAWEYKLFI